MRSALNVRIFLFRKEISWNKNYRFLWKIWILDMLDYKIYSKYRVFLEQKLVFYHFPASEFICINCLCSTSSIYYSNNEVAIADLTNFTANFKKNFGMANFFWKFTRNFAKNVENFEENLQEAPYWRGPVGRNASRANLLMIISVVLEKI